MTDPASPFEQLKLTGWQCVACHEWNNLTRKECWNCGSPPEARKVPDKELGGEG